MNKLQVDDLLAIEIWETKKKCEFKSWSNELRAMYSIELNKMSIFDATKSQS